MIGKLFYLICKTLIGKWLHPIRAWDDPNVMASNFYDLFHSILDVHAPLKTRKGIFQIGPL